MDLKYAHFFGAATNTPSKDIELNLLFRKLSFSGGAVQCSSTFTKA